jgi:hypothetical protein
MSIDIEDQTGMPVPVAEYDEALAVTRKYLVRLMTTLPPEFAVQIPNIIRCLEQGRALTAVVEERRKAT